MDWTYVDANPTRPGYESYRKEIEKSLNDDREYRLIRLENGLQALIIHDATAVVSGACMNVAVGQLMDPDDIPGLAHFCEHMLFSGTAQYPTEGEFPSYITSHGGSRNATTGADNTTYHFCVSSSALSGALSRFSAMFRSPLFTPSATRRELFVIDSEDKRNHQHDFSRMDQVMKCLSCPGHPWSRFGSGNLRSLTCFGHHTENNNARGGIHHEGINGVDKDDEGGEVGRETRRRLIEWWNKYYCAGRMKLVILGRDTVEELIDLAVTLFSPIKNRGLEAHTTYSTPYGEDECGTVVFVKTVVNMFSLELVFPIPCQAPHFRVKPAQFIGYILGNGSVDSLSSYLKSTGWVSRLFVSSQTPAEGLDAFRVQVDLTPVGLTRYRDVVATIYHFIRILRTFPLPLYIYDELKQLSALGFRFQHQSSNIEGTITELAERLQSPYCPGELLLSSSCFREWDETPVQELLETLHPQNMRVVLAAKDLDHIAPPGEWNREKWYGAEYKVTKLDEEFIGLLSISQNIPEIMLPKPNGYIPMTLQVEKHTVLDPLIEPRLLQETLLSHLWHKKDDQFWVPQGSITLLLISPVANKSPRHTVMTEIYTNFLRQILDRDTYPALAAGLSYVLTNDPGALSLRVSGYSERLPLLLRSILETMKGFSTDHESFHLYRNASYHSHENFEMLEPAIIGEYLCRYLLDINMWTHEDCRLELSTLTIDEFNAHCVELLSCLHIRTLVLGNIDQEAALSIMKEIESILRPEPLSSSEIPLPKTLFIPNGCSYIWRETLSNENEMSSSVTYFCHIGNFEDRRTYPLVALLSQIICGPCFHQLRTVEQLGYSVYNRLAVWTPSVGLLFSIQGELDPSFCEARLDAFLENVEDHLRALTKKEFQGHLASLIASYEKKPQTLEEERQRLAAPIRLGNMNFRIRQQYADCLRQVALDDVIELFMTHVHPASATRSKLSVHLGSQKLGPNYAVTSGTATTLIRNAKDFKSNLLASQDSAISN